MATRPGDELGAEALALPMPPQPHAYLARMARFTNGSVHSARRAELLAVLPPVEGLEDAACSLTAGQLRDRLDVVPLARAIPVIALGEAPGVGANMAVPSSLVMRRVTSACRR